MIQMAATILVFGVSCGFVGYSIHAMRVKNKPYLAFMTGYLRALKDHTDLDEAQRFTALKEEVKFRIEANKLPTDD